MPSWVDCNPTSNYFGGFACDMGPYIGPWPLLPPGELTGLTPSDEIDFVVTLPNPTDPTDITIVGDYSYDTPLWDAWRFPNSSPPPDSFYGYYGDSTGPSAPFPIPASMPTGAHLYVVAYTAAAPANPPEFYVPPSYAAGGAAAVETAMGHWSGVQGSFTRTGTPSAAAFGFTAEQVIAEGGTGFDAAVEIDAAVADLQALSAGGWTGPLTFAANLVGAEKSSTGTVRAVAAPAGSVLNASAAVGQQPNTTGLDASVTPYIDSSGNAGPPTEYEAASPLSVTIDGTLHIESAGGSIGSYFDVGGNFAGIDYFPIKFDVFTEDLTSATPLPPPYGSYIATNYAAGETAGSGGDDLAFSIPSAYGSVGTVPTFLRTGHAVAPDVADGFDYREGTGVAISGLVATWTGTYPPWRYWISGDVVPVSDEPKWHTVGGHWATVGGATMQILTPLSGGSAWVDVVDGPA